MVCLGLTGLLAADFSGVVKDPSGGVVPGAAVELRGAQTVTAKTDAAGAFSFQNAPDGVYSLTITYSGFVTFTRSVTLPAAAATYTLEVAGKQDTVTVAGKASGANVEPAYLNLREMALSDTRRVENLVIKRDSGIFTLKSGILAFTAPLMGRVTSAVFTGEGTFELTPAPFLEKDYLKMVTGKASINENLKRVYFVFTDGAYAEIVKQTKPAESDGRGMAALSYFRNKLRSRQESARSMVESLMTSEAMDNLDADVLIDLYNPNRPGFFDAYIEGQKFSDLRFYYRPRGRSFGSVYTPEEVAVVNVAPGDDLEGIWYASHILSEYAEGKGTSLEDKRMVRTQHYKVETAIGKNEHLTAVCDFKFQAVESGDRLVKFGLLPTLRVSRVSMNGKEIHWIQESRKSDGSFYVVLPEATVKDQSYTVSIEYAGDKVVHDAGGGNFSVGARTSWYPSVNAFNDRATFDLTFKVPKQYTVVSVGKLARVWTEVGNACSQWVSGVPLAVAGFNYGLFKKKEMVDDATKYNLEVYASEQEPDYMKGAGFGSLSSTSLMQSALVQSRASMQIFQRYFGPVPYGRLAITEQPEFNFGQSWPSLVYLPISAFLDATQRFSLGMGQRNMTDFIEEVTAHEVSHQWWGHLVGWASYRDQWLSEGTAFFSASLFLQFTEKKMDKFLKYWESARDRLFESNQYGKKPNDVAPIYLGLRLATPKTGSAYSIGVYRKGGYIFHTLRYMMYDAKTGDAEFIKMMQDFVTTHTHKNASTESFLEVVNRHMTPQMDLGGDKTMDWFFMQFVYGTQVPKYTFTYDVTQEAGQWMLSASLQQSGVTDDFKMLVPLYVELDGNKVMLGRIRMVGNSTNDKIKVPLPKKPTKAMINAFFDVLERKS